MNGTGGSSTVFAPVRIRGTCSCLTTGGIQASLVTWFPPSPSLSPSLPLPNHSYYTGNPLSALHSLQQLQAGASFSSPVLISASTRESHGAATSCSVSCPQVTHSAISPQVQTGPTRTVTSDLMSATLAEAATQLSFVAFLERCISASASPPPISGCHHADYSTHRCLSERFYATLARGVLGSTFHARCSLPHVFPTRPFVTS